MLTVTDSRAWAYLQVDGHVPPAPGDEQNLTSPADALQRLHRALLALLVEVEEPLYEGDGASHVCSIITGMNTCQHSMKVVSKPIDSC